MKSSGMAVALMFLLSVAGLATGQQKPTRQPLAVGRGGIVRIGPTPLGVSSPAVTPNPLSLSGTDPDNVPAVTATATFSFAAKSVSQWTLVVGAPTNFTNCAGIPASAVTVSCISVDTSKCQGGTGQCGASTPLGTTPVQIAQGTGANCNTGFTVTITYTFNDDWKYTAGSCSLPVTYTLSGQ